MPRRLLLPRLALALTLAMPSAAAAQGLPIDPPLQVPGVTYDPAIPAPEQVIGHRIGTRHTPAIDDLRKPRVNRDRISRSRAADTGSKCQIRHWNRCCSTGRYSLI